MRSGIAVALGALAALWLFPAAAEEAGVPSGQPKSAEQAAVSPSTLEKARAYFTDLPLVTQDGKPVRFFSDVLQGKVVAVNLLYTSCTDACPLIANQLSLVQDLLGDELGERFRIVSLTIDPKTDTPEVLKDYANRFEAKEGWLFLTGSEENVSEVARRLGQVDDDIGNHLTYLMIGNVDEGRWAKVPANLPPQMIVAQLRRVAGDDPFP